MIGFDVLNVWLLPVIYPVVFPKKKAERDPTSRILSGFL
jgi:hypothetical protein